MPARQVYQNFFHGTLAPFHRYRQNALLDATIVLVSGTSLTLTSTGRYLPGNAQVKNKIKRVDRLLGNESLHHDIPLIFRGIISVLASKLSLCVIAVDWNGYPSQEYHVLHTSLICYGHSIPLLSQIVPSEEQQNAKIQQAFLNTLSEAVNPKARVAIVAGAGLQNARLRHIRSLDWDFIGRVRDNKQLHLARKGECWFRCQELQASNKPEYLGPGTLSQAEYVRYDDHFYLHKREPKGRRSKYSRCGIARSSRIKDVRSAAKESWLIFSSTDNLKPREVMKLYSRRMQIEQNFRDEKSECFGFGLQASYNCSAGGMLVLSLLATLSTVVLWLTDCHAEDQGLHLRYQVNSIKTRWIISYLTLAENVLRHSPLILKRTVLGATPNHLTRTYQNMVSVYYR